MTIETDFSGWIGRRITREDRASPRLLAEYRATLGANLFESGGAIPPGFHWGLAPAMPLEADTGADGAEAKGTFLPPIPLPRRMWAGGLVETFRAIAPDSLVTRRSELSDIRRKQGQTGPLWLLSITHHLSDAEGPLLRERQDLVFRETAPLAAEVTPVEGALAGVDRVIDATPLLLFRFSAFTFNGHRIHYDVPYAAEEGYPGLLVHGPMQAALMFNALARHLGAVPPAFAYRCLAPLSGGQRFGVSCRDDGAGPVARITRCDGVTTAEGRVPAPGT